MKRLKLISLNLWRAAASSAIHSFSAHLSSAVSRAIWFAGIGMELCRFHCGVWPADDLHANWTLRRNSRSVELNWWWLAIRWAWNRLKIYRFGTSLLRAPAGTPCSGHLNDNIVECARAQWNDCICFRAKCVIANPALHLKNAYQNVQIRVMSERVLHCILQCSPLQAIKAPNMRVSCVHLNNKNYCALQTTSQHTRTRIINSLRPILLYARTFEMNAFLWWFSPSFHCFSLSLIVLTTSKMPT